MKTTVILMLLGVIAGAVIASFVVPPALSWYTTPGGLPGGADVQAVVQIPAVIRFRSCRMRFVCCRVTPVSS